MNKLKRISAIMLCFLMMFSFIPTYAFQISEDVAGTAYEESAYVLGALGIMVGDAGTGNFRPDDGITRAEFARVAVSLIGLDDVAYASQGVSKFSDVPTTHWANGYINVATSQNLIIGKDDGTFDPESPITYQDAITILIRALGYEPTVASKGGYPGGYLSVATQIGLTKNATSGAEEAVKRGIVANLSNNALTIDLMEQTGFGSDIKYEVVDKTILEDKLDIIYNKGQITANGYSTLTEGSALEKDEVSINGEIFKIGESNAGNYLGYYVNYYAKEDENGLNKTLILVRPEKSRNNTLTVDNENIETAAKEELEYWVNKDTDKNTKKIKIASDAKMVYNGVGIDFDVSLLSNEISGTVKLLEITGDGKYDVVFVDEIKNIIVEDVIESSYKIVDKYGNPSLTIDPEDTNYSFVMVDKNNETVKLEDLKEWDVLSYTISKDSSLIRISVSRETVSGVVTEISENRYTIDGKEYKVAKNFEETLKLQDEGVFYLDVYGKIAAVNKAATTDKNYAYLINAGANGSIDTTASFKILNVKGEIQTLTAEEKIKFNGTNGKLATEVIDEIKKDGKVTSQLITIKTNASGKITEIDLATDKTGSGLTVDKYDFVKNFAGEDVVFKSNSSKLGKFNITDETIVFDIPASSDDYTEYTVRDKKMFENESKYNVSVFDVTEDLNAGVVIVTNSDGKTNLESPIAVVSKITTARNEDGEEVEKLYAAYNGEIVTFETKGTGILVKGDKKSLEAGDVIQFKLDAKGVIEKFDLLFDISEKGTEFTKDVSDKMTVVYGKVTKKFANSVNVTVNDGSVENFSLEGVNVYSYNSEKTSNKVSVVTSADIQRYDSSNPSRVFIRMYDDMVKEIIIVK